MEKGKETGGGTEEAYESKTDVWSEMADCALSKTMTRSSKTPNSSQPRSLMFGTLSAAAVAVLFLFLYFQSGSLAGDPPHPDPQGSWKHVHQALGISLGISQTTPREQPSAKPSPGHILPLRLVDSERTPESPKDRVDFLQDFAAALQSTSGKPKRRQ